MSEAKGPAASAARRIDVAVRPLRPVSLFDEFRAVWPTGDTSDTASAFVRALVKGCAA